MSGLGSGENKLGGRIFGLGKQRNQAAIARILVGRHCDAGNFPGLGLFADLRLKFAAPTKDGQRPEEEQSPMHSCKTSFISPGIQRTNPFSFFRAR
jgi:hypothetical protein